MPARTILGGCALCGEGGERHKTWCVRLRRLERALVVLVQTSLTAAWSSELRELVKDIERDLKGEGDG